MINAKCALAVGLVAAIAAGCSQSKLDPANMADMKPPPRPAELDRLDAWVGTWEGEGEMTMPGAEAGMKLTWTVTRSWEVDRRFLVERMTLKMSDDNETSFMGVWTWDAGAGEYRFWGFSGLGTTETGAATYDEDTQTWHIRSTGTNPMTGKPSYSAGTMKEVDNSTTTGTWNEWDNVLKWGEPTRYTLRTRRK